MPLNVRRFYTSIFFVLFSFAVFANGQTVDPATQQAPTSGDVMRDRIARSKAFIAVRNYNAAIYELENIRRESGDPAVRGVVNVLLINSYLEQGDFKRAQEFLKEIYGLLKTTQPNALENYLAVAGQVVKGSRNRLERYQALGLSVSDRTLPLEAINDLEKMRETLEIVISESKEVGADRTKAPGAMALLEEASNSRSMLARDEYDSRRWKDELADTREKMTNARSVVISAVNDPNAAPPAAVTTAATTPNVELVAENTKPAETAPTMLPVADTRPAAPAVTREREVKTSEPAESTNQQPPAAEKKIIPSAPPTVKEESKPKPAAPVQQPASDAVGDGSPIDVGSLVAFATEKRQPVYPAAARMLKTTGVVKVEITVDENGDVADIGKASGPTLLQGAARDAIKNWKFKPFVRDGQPVKAIGFVSFNFNL